jgi:hypothetical protein
MGPRQSFRKLLQTQPFIFIKGGQTTILVRWSAAQRTTEMLATSELEKIADQHQRTTEIELLLFRC